MPDKKYNVSVSNGVHKQRLGKLQKVFVKWNNYIPLSKKTHPDVNIGFSKFCDLRPKCCVLADSRRTHSVYVCSSHQNAMLLVDVMDWDLAYKDLIKKIIYNPESNKCIIHRSESCPGTATLKEFLDQELSDHEYD